jgi:hypothetical protein
MNTTLKNPAIHQCAWCKSYIVDGSRIDASNIDTSQVDSHGICEICACTLEMQVLDIYNNE